MLAENTDTEQTSQSSQSDEVLIELEALKYELQELQENSLNLMKEKASLVSQLANPALTKQESRSNQKVKKRLKLIEKEIEELNENIETLQSRIESVKLYHNESSQKITRSPICELQRDYSDSLNVIEVETHCTDELCLMIISQNSRLQESTKHSVTTCIISLKTTEEADNCASGHEEINDTRENDSVDSVSEVAFVERITQFYCDSP